MDYVQALGERVWVARRVEIAQHWAREHPPAAVPSPPPDAIPSSSVGNVPSPISSLLPSSASNGMNAPRLLITGGAGFVLSHVVNVFLGQHGPRATAVVFDQDRAWDGVVRRFLAEFLDSGRLKFFHGDVSDQDSWARLTQVLFVK